MDVELPDLAVFFCLRFVPETKGKQLEEIEAIFEERVAAKRAAS